MKHRKRWKCQKECQHPRLKEGRKRELEHDVTADKAEISWALNKK
jgi:hypothetical protein